MMKFSWRRKKENKLEKCPVCAGTGKVKDEKCQSCGGAGFIMLGDITRTINVNQAQSNTQGYQRNVNDIQIQVLEGLSDTRQIFVNAWSKEDALDMLKKIREELAAKK